MRRWIHLFLAASALLSNTSCHKTRNSKLRDKFDADVERIDLGRGINTATGLAAGDCLIMDPNQDIVELNSAIKWSGMTNRKVVKDQNGNQFSDAAPAPRQVNPREFYWSINYIQNSYDLKQQLEVAAAGKYNGGVSLSGSAKFAQSIQVHEDSLYLLVDLFIVSSQRKINLHSPTVTLESRLFPAASTPNRDKMWVDACGDHVITGVTYGARRIVVLEIQNMTKDKSKELALQFQAGGLTGSGSASFSERFSEIARSSSINVTGMQFGGELNSLSALMNPEGVIKDTELWMKNVQDKAQYVEIAYSSEPWVGVPQYSQAQSTNGLGIVQGRKSQIESFARNYGKYRDMLAYIDYASSRPYMFSTATPFKVNGKAVPGISPEMKVEISNLAKNVSQYLAKVEAITSECAQDESKCIYEINLIERGTPAKGSSTIGDAANTNSIDLEAKKYVDRIADIDAAWAKIGLSSLNIPEYREDAVCLKLAEMQPIYKKCENPNAGPAAFRLARHPSCGVDTLAVERAEHCGVEHFNSRHSCDECGQARLFGGCKECESSRFGVAQFRECAVEPQVVVAYRECETAENGAAKFRESRDPSCGIEHYPSCVVMKDASGQLIPLNPQDYYNSLNRSGI